MWTRIAIIILAMMPLSPLVARGAAHYHQEINVKAAQGKDLVMVLDEMEKHERYSIIKVKRAAGGSMSGRTLGTRDRKRVN